nr:hypothetical protein [Petralouisia muris]
MGRAVLILKMPRIRKGRAIILELKAVKRFQDMEKGCQEAMWQMEEKGIGRNCGRKAMRYCGIWIVFLQERVCCKNGGKLEMGNNRRENMVLLGWR